MKLRNRLELLFSTKTSKCTRPLYLLIAPITVMEGPRFLISESFIPAVTQQRLSFCQRWNVVSSM
jgi:hypothetical protein